MSERAGSSLFPFRARRLKGRYPKGAVDASLDAMELAYSYLRGEKLTAAEKLADAMDRLYRFREIETGEPHPYRSERG